MSDDIVARLRDCDGGYGFRGIVREAADEIERLRALIVKLRRDYSEAEKDHVDCVVAYHHSSIEIKRLRAELRSYTGDKHSTREPFERKESDR